MVAGDSCWQYLLSVAIPVTLAIAAPVVLFVFRRRLRHCCKRKTSTDQHDLSVCCWLSFSHRSFNCSHARVTVRACSTLSPSRRRSTAAPTQPTTTSTAKAAASWRPAHVAAALRRTAAQRTTTRHHSCGRAVRGFIIARAAWGSCAWYVLLRFVCCSINVAVAANERGKLSSAVRGR